MKKINGFENVQAMVERVKLPAGGYLAKCIGAKVVQYTGSNGGYERLEIAVDITDGEHKDYYKNDYDASTQEGKKWKGVCRLYVPTEDGSDKDALTQKILKGATTAFEDSNSGYHWDWDESKLKGKVVGILVRDKEYDYMGKQGFAPEIFALTSTQAIKDGKFKTPKAKYLNGSSAPTTAPTGNSTDVGGDDYPF